MIRCRLKISAQKESVEVSFNGLGRRHSKTTDTTREKTRTLASLYYGKTYTDEALLLAEEIEKKFYTKNEMKYITTNARYAQFLKSMGNYIFQEVLPKEIADEIRSLPPSSMIQLDVDENLSHLPWELMHTGHNFLCLEYILGRTFNTIKDTPEPTKGPIPMLLVANPTGDLYGSQNEANYILSQFRGSNLRISRYGPEIKKSDYLQLLRSGKFDIVHYTGHSQSSPTPGECRHLFRDSDCYGHEIETLTIKKPPHLVFSNSCQSAEDSLEKDETGNTSLAGAYLKAGVGACIGTIWQVSDVGASNFASDFYRYILFGATLGEALFNARRASFKRWGYDVYIWASYIFFGDPDIRLIKKN